MMTNCPNCGAPLSRDGHCSYCKTHVVPTIDVFNSGSLFSYGSITDLNINVTDPYGNSFTIPLAGRIEEVTITADTYCENEVEFNFVGRIRE